MKRMWQNLLVLLGFRKRIELLADEKTWMLVRHLARHADVSVEELFRRALINYAIAARHGGRLGVFDPQGKLIRICAV